MVKAITSRDESEQISSKQAKIEHSSYEGTSEASMDDDCDHHYTYFEASESETDVDDSQSGEEDNEDESHNKFIGWASSNSETF